MTPNEWKLAHGLISQQVFDTAPPPYSLPKMMVEDPYVQAAMEHQGAGRTVVATLGAAIPALRNRQPCPDCHYPNRLYQTVVHLNEAHHWSREQIADWLETLDADLAFRPPEGRKAS